MLVVVVVEVGCRLSGDRTGPYQSRDVVVVHCSAHLAFLLYEDGGVQITFIFFPPCPLAASTSLCITPPQPSSALHSLFAARGRARKNSEDFSTWLSFSTRERGLLSRIFFLVGLVSRNVLVCRLSIRAELAQSIRCGHSVVVKLGC